MIDCDRGCGWNEGIGGSRISVLCPECPWVMGWPKPAPEEEEE